MACYFKGVNAMMMKKNKLPILLLGITLSLMSLLSCVSSYQPAPAHVPLLTEKGDVTMSFQLATNGPSLHAAGAFSDHVVGGITVNPFERNRRIERRQLIDIWPNFQWHTNVTEIKSRGYNLEAISGYTSTFFSKGVFECLGGYGFSRANYSFKKSAYGEYVYYKHAGNIHNIFIQPSLGIKKRTWEGALSMKLMQSYLVSDQLVGNANSTSIGYYLTARGNLPGVQLQAQIGAQIFGEGSEQMDWLYNEPLYFSLGAQINLGKKEKD
jgi:hypothetical protein